MKTTSITSIIAILGATAALNLSALAGPGAHSENQVTIASQKSVPTIAFGGSKSVSHEIPYVFTNSGRVSAPTLETVQGPHGNVYLYRW